jgi:hypothetical protein
VVVLVQLIGISGSHHRRRHLVVLHKLG